ncbi:MAG: glycoside hydrolase family 9 protein [Fibrobacterota bacterium]
MQHYPTFKHLFFCLCLGIGSVFAGSEVKTWFDDGYVSDAFSFAFGGRSQINTIIRTGTENDSALKIDLDDHTSSGAEVSWASKTVDLSSIRNSGALSFKIKGEKGGERVFIGLKDNGGNGKAKVQVKCRSDNYFDVEKEWKEVLIPLRGFSDDGEKWHDEHNAPEFGYIDWSEITSIVFSSQKEQNLGKSRDRIATLYVDDLKIIHDLEKMPAPAMLPWKLRTETVPGDDAEKRDTADILFSWLGEKLAPFTSAYTYGDPTDFRIIQPESGEVLPVFAAYLSDNEWSGVTLNRGRKFAVDIEPYLQTGGVSFQVRGAHGGEVFAIGLIDDDSDGADKKVQSSVESRNYLKVTKEWQQVKIPFSDFNEIGRWWDSDAHQNVMSTIDWTKIAELRFSTNKGANRHARNDEESPVALYFSDIRFTKDIGVFNREQYWKEFRSDAPDKMLDDYENEGSVARWQVSLDTTSEMAISEGKGAENKGRAVQIDFRMGAWGSAFRPLTDSLSRDWSKHRCIRFDFYSSKPIEKFAILVQDAGNEAWSAYFEAKSGWQRIILPFSQFELFEYWQPGDSKINRRMDLEAVRSYHIRPAHPGSEGRIMLDNVALTNDNAYPQPGSIRANQLGYMVGKEKRFVVSDSAAKNFSITDEKGKTVFSGKLGDRRFWDLSGEYVAIGDFTSVNKPGTYKIVIKETGEKTAVVVGKDIYADAFDASVKAFYYQRAWLDLEPEFAGKWSRKKGTPDTACQYHQSAGKQGTRDVSGGWYDAGDFGKYVVNGGISVGTLLALYELFPDRMSDELSIPESGNSIPDILDEVRYEIDWMKKMQDSDGGVFFKVGPLKWDGYVMPAQCESKRFVIGKSTTSSLNFAAVMAMAGRIYRQIDSAYGRDCVARAEKAWRWARKNPEIREPSEHGGSGAYADSKFEDEFFWAACELFTTTKEDRYKDFLHKRWSISRMTTAANWQNVHNLGWFTLATHFDGKELALADSARTQIARVADIFLEQMDSIPYRIPSNSFMWGSNSEQLNHAIVMAYAHRLTGGEKYINAALETCDYIFGKNAVGYSFVTGFGQRSSNWPHHRIMASDGIDAAFPGFVVGGPNNGLQDTQDPSVHYHHTEPARAYLDKVASYASNEIAINWNAALAFVLGYVCLAEKD